MSAPRQSVRGSATYCDTLRDTCVMCMPDYVRSDVAISIR